MVCSKRTLNIIDKKFTNLYSYENYMYYYDEKKLIYMSSMKNNIRSKTDIIELEELEQYINLFYFYDDHNNIYYYDENKFVFIRYSLSAIEQQFINSTKYKNSKIDIRYCYRFIKNTLKKYKNNNLINHKKNMIESDKPLEILKNVSLEKKTLVYITLLNFYKSPSYTKHKVIYDKATELKKQIKELQKQLKKLSKSNDEEDDILPGKKFYGK